MKKYTKRQIATIMRSAAKLFDKNPDRWCAGEVAPLGGGMCMLGACGLVENGRRSYPGFASSCHEADTLPCVSEATGAATGYVFYNIARLNDSRHLVNSGTDAAKYLRRIARALDHGGKL